MRYPFCFIEFFPHFSHISTFLIKIYLGNSRKKSEIEKFLIFFEHQIAAIFRLLKSYNFPTWAEFDFQYLAIIEYHQSLKSLIFKLFHSVSFKNIQSYSEKRFLSGSRNNKGNLLIIRRLPLLHLCVFPTFFPHLTSEASILVR